MTKYYAQQTDPREQMSPWNANDGSSTYWLDGEAFDGEPTYAIFGNRHYTEYIPGNIKEIIAILNNGNCYEDLQAVLHPDDDVETYCGESTITGIINYYFMGFAGGRTEFEGYNDYTATAIASEVMDWDSARSVFDEQDILSVIMTDITGHVWERGTLRGVSQSDWNGVLYDTHAFDREALQMLETDYFNMGLEMSLYDVETGEFRDCVYLSWGSYDIEKIKEEIEFRCDLTEDEELVEIRLFDGYVETPTWKTVMC